MYCSNCEKFALLPQIHGCICCPKFCNYKEQRWCNDCSNSKNICCVCGKTISNNKDNDLKLQVEYVHPFYNSGCHSCGGKRR